MAVDGYMEGGLQGALGAAQGGKFGAGFLAAGVTSGYGSKFGQVGNRVTKVIGAAVLGGTVSRIGVETPLYADVSLMREVKVFTTTVYEGSNKVASWPPTRKPQDRYVEMYHHRASQSASTVLTHRVTTAGPRLWLLPTQSSQILRDRWADVEVRANANGQLSGR